MSKFEATLDRWIERNRFHGLELPCALPNGKLTAEEKALDAGVIGACFLAVACFASPPLAAVVILNAGRRQAPPYSAAVSFQSPSPNFGAPENSAGGNFRSTGARGL